MRQVLVYIPWDGVSIGGVTVPLFGFGVFFWIWVALGAWTVYAIYFRSRDSQGESIDLFSVGFWLALAVAIVQSPQFGPKFAPNGLPIFGYGFMLLLGLLSAVWLAERRARLASFPPETIWDLAIWLFIPGIIGGRVFYLVQYSGRVYADTKNLQQFLWNTVNVSEGGLVLYGALIAGTVGFFSFCAVRRLHAFDLADIIMPSVFIGIGFGRIGCLLNGCCFGDRCSLPWGLEFPPDSGPYMALVVRGFLAPDAASTPPLHPTQLYSAFDGFLTAALCLWYYRYRRVPGDVLGLALLICPTTRFLIEFIRGDEYGQWGTSLTISQLISLGLLATGLLFQGYLAWQVRTRTVVKSPPREQPALAMSSKS
ncbi:MAG: hypothetical protein B7Z55_06890 [Planctomycetales bacterium 12-60-4]|nr:MAG: hypothetical protein B7Z55_06890 [Planctomycetales bacterium 12-60-4]